MEFIFGQAATVESLDKVPEQFRGLYQQGDNGYTLNEAFVPIGGAIDGLNKSLKAARRDADEAKRSRPDLSQFATIGQLLGVEGDEATNPETLRSALEAKLTESREGKVNWDKMKASLETGFNSRLQQKDLELQTMGKSLQKYLVQNAAIQAIAAHKGVPDLLLPHIATRTKVVKVGDDFEVRVVDETGDPRGNAAGGFMGVEDLVKELKAHPTFGRAFESEAPSGNGARPGAGQQRPVQRPAQMSATDKIKAGLQKQKRG